MKKIKIGGFARIRAHFRRKALGAGVCLLLALAAAGCGKGKSLIVQRALGMITIISEPQGAIIEFDGLRKGWAYAGKPIVIKGISGGWHTIKATLTGHVPRIEEVKIDRPAAKVTLRLSRSTFGRLSIVVSPPGAEVFVDSRYYGKANPEKNVDSLAFGEHTLYIRKKGFLPERRSIVVERQFHRAYRLRLQPEN